MRLTGLVGLLVAVGCSTPASKVERPTALGIAESAFGTKLERGATLVHVEHGFTAGKQLAMVLPERADGVVRLTHGQLGAAWIEQRALEVRPAAATPHGSALVFADARDGVDIILSAEEHRFEELRVITRREGLRPMRWSLRLGPGLASLRVRDGRIEALEPDGTARLATAPIVAYDAHKNAVRMGIALAGKGSEWELTLTPDADAALPVTVDPAWAPTTAMNQLRANVSLVDLGAGQVLVLGGTGDPYGEPTASSTVEKWDPKTSTWSYVASMNQNRVFAAALRLADGRVFIAGGGRVGIDGYPLGQCLQSGEIYDPKTNTWKKTAMMSVMRGLAGVHQLTSGKVLVFGGDSCGGLLDSSELYDPTTDTWETGPKLPVPLAVWGRYAPLGGDQLLVSGFSYDGTKTKTFTFDGRTFKEIGPVVDEGRNGPDAVVPLGPGKALLMNGFYDAGGYYAASTSAHVFDLPTLTFTKVAATDGRWAAASVALPGGKVMVMGGQQGFSITGGTTIYDAATDTWTPTTTSLSFPRRGLNAVVSSTGQVLAVGASKGQKEVDVYDACSTGFFADGACCDKACTGPCERCDLPGKVGTCSPIAAGSPRDLRTCGDYLCGATGACITKCTNDGECVAGRFCDASGVCTPKLAKGTACADGNDCTSGFCVDGVCCDKACDGQCEACDLTGIAGTCAPVEGKVHGARTPCEAAGEQCGKFCDGVDRKACVWRGADVSCGDDGCLGNTARKKGVCKEGVCQGESRDCAPYRCGATGCPSACADSSECMNGFVCVEKACVAPPKETRCSDDRRSVLAFDGSVKATCVDYLCEAGQCKVACTSSSDCFPGLVCKTDTSTCVVPSTVAADAGDSGCAYGGSPKGEKSASGLVLLMMMAGVARRRVREAR